ncbi:hypothetical protein AB0B42_00595 [Streptomyces fradiae]|uniref:hypothetical protein n=1 Tax=Streptomyces fradiae TaxID=1906 RepID=UPI0033FF486D
MQTSLTRGQIAILAATAIPMIAAGAAGGYGTYTNITAEVGRSETALGVLAAGEGVALVLALLVVGLTMLGQSIPAIVRAGLWAAPLAAAGTGIATADSLTEAVIYTITPMAMSTSAEGLGLLARRIVVHRDGRDAEAERQNAETVQRLAYLHARTTGHPSRVVRWRSERAAWRLLRRVGVGDAQLGTQLVGVQRDRLTGGADAALALMLGASASGPQPLPAATVQPQPEFDSAADEAVAVAQPQPQPQPQPFVLDLAPMQPVHPELRAPHPHTPDPQPPQPTSAAASTAGQGPDAVSRVPNPDADAQLLAAAAELNAAALAETGRPASLRTLQSELRIGQRRAQRIQQQLARSA